MKILKAKITKDNTLVASYMDDDENTVTVDGKNLVHKDLVAAFKELTGHMAILCELREAKENSIPDDLTNISSVEVNGYSIGGTDEDEGVTLIGKRFLKSKKVLNLIAPFTKFDNENEEYPHAFTLMQAIDACNYEVVEYLTNKKWAVVQQELPFDGNAPQDIQADTVADASTVSEAEKFLTGLADKIGADMVSVNGNTIVMKGKRRNRKKEEVA